MESIELCLSDAPQFDALLECGLPEGGDLKIITKEDGLNEGLSAAMITFSVQLPDGNVERAQAVVSIRELRTVLREILTHHGRER